MQIGLLTAPFGDRDQRTAFADAIRLGGCPGDLNAGGADDHAAAREGKIASKMLPGNVVFKVEAPLCLQAACGATAS